MFTSLKNAFKIKEVRNRILFTLAMVVVVRFGSQLPVPGTNRDFFAVWFASQSGDIFNLFNAFTGGSFSNFSVLALVGNWISLLASWSQFSFSSRC